MGGPPPQSGPCASFPRLRDDAKAKADAVSAVGERKGDRQQMRAAVQSFTTAEEKVVKFLEDNKRGCGVPDQAVTQARAMHVNTLKFRDTVCAEGPKPKAPTLSDAIGTTRRFGDNTKTGSGTLDTLTGNAIQDERRRARRRFDRQLGRSAGARRGTALSAPRPARPPDRLVAAAHSVLVVGGARRRSRPTRAAPNLSHLALFFIGAFAMRGAGCTWNDIVDRDLDGRVERTRSRPIPSGQVSVAQAALFLVIQALVGLAVLMQFNRFAIATGIASLAIVAVYPFMKRITYWPQIVLGLAFSWGALMGWAAAFGRLDAARRWCSMPARSPG